MAPVYTLDASVFLNAFLPQETGHTASFGLLARLRESAAPMLEPTLLLPEVAAAIGRTRGDPDYARSLVTTIGGLPHLTLVPLDDAVARQAVDVAARQRLRGSDAVYAAVALRYGSTLVTRDREQLTRLAGVLTTRTPDEALAELD